MALSDRYNSEEFQLCLCLRQNIAQSVQEILRHFPGGHKRNLMTKSIQKTLDPVIPKLLKVVISGLTSHGKSSLLNAVCGHKQLAKTGANGKAVTNILQEFKQRSKGEVASYMVKCTHLSRAKKLEVLITYWDDIQRFAMTEPDETNEDYKMELENYRLATEIVEAVFETVLGFDIDRLINIDSSITREDAIEQMAEGLDKIDLTQNNCGEDVQRFNDSEDLLRATSKIQSSPLWPFYDKITTFTDARVLRNGLTIVDPPGLADSNYAKAKISFQCLSDADEIWVVAEIARAVDNANIKEVIDRFYGDRQGRRKSGDKDEDHDVGRTSRPNITIICTKAAYFAETCPWEHEADMKEAVDEESLNEARRKISEAGTPEEEELAKFDMSCLIMSGRNRMVTEALKKRYANRIPPQKLKIFCVDSHLFWDSDKSAEKSGIPSLTQHATNLMSRVCFKVYNKSMTREMPAIIDAVENWYSLLKGQEEGTATVELPDLSELACYQTLKSWSQTINSDFRIIPMTIKKKMVAIIGGATATIKSWQLLHPCTMAAHCRKGGRHARHGRKRNGVCWNTDLVASFNKHTASRWKKSDATNLAAWDELIRDITEIFQTYRANCAQADAPTITLKSIDTAIKNAKNNIKDERQRFENEYEALKSRASDGAPDSHMGKYMSTHAYTQCTVISGKKGVTKERLDILTAAVKQTEFVIGFAERVRADLATLMKDTKDNLARHVQEAIDLIAPEAQRGSGKTDLTPFFKKHPKKRIAIEKELAHIKANMAEMADMARPTQEWAAELGWIDASEDSDNEDGDGDD